MALQIDSIYFDKLPRDNCQSFKHLEEVQPFAIQVIMLSRQIV